MEKERETEIVEGVVSSKALDLARGALRRHKKRVKISKMCSIMVPILLGILVIGTPLLMHYNNVGNTVYWKEMIIQAQTEYEKLEKTSITSIEELNKEAKAKFYWIEHATITGSYLLKQDNTIILIEEHYLVDDVECVIYIKNKHSIIEEIEVSKKLLDKSIIIENRSTIQYGFLDNEQCYGTFSRDYDYLLTISTTDTTTIETIFSNLTNN